MDVSRIDPSINFQKENQQINLITAEEKPKPRPVAKSPLKKILQKNFLKSVDKKLSNFYEKSNAFTSSKELKFDICLDIISLFVDTRCLYKILSQFGYKLDAQVMIAEYWTRLTSCYVYLDQNNFQVRPEHLAFYYSIMNGLGNTIEHFATLLQASFNYFENFYKKCVVVVSRKDPRFKECQKLTRFFENSKLFLKEKKSIPYDFFPLFSKHTEHLENFYKYLMIKIDNVSKDAQEQYRNLINQLYEDKNYFKNINNFFDLKK